MSLTEALDTASAKATGERPYFLVPEVERVLAITMAVAQELAVTRERLDTVERLLIASGNLIPGAVDTFVPSTSDAHARSLWLQEYLVRILRVVQQQAEAAVGR